MSNQTLRPIAFMLASTNHGSMILNRFDSHIVDEKTGAGYGVGHQLMNRSAFDPQEINLALMVLNLLRKHRGNEIVAIDGGANLGVHTIEWARHMHGWGRVIAFEAQERIYYALAGNIAINNCFNAQARFNALGAKQGVLRIPQPNYLKAGSFGSLELKPRQKTEFIGQTVSYEDDKLVEVQMVSIDSLGLSRLDFLKLDIEGMEIEGLEGARKTLMKHRPALLIEQIKADQTALKKTLASLGYQTFGVGMNLLCIPENDPMQASIKLQGTELSINLK